MESLCYWILLLQETTSIPLVVIPFLLALRLACARSILGVGQKGDTQEEKFFVLFISLTQIGWPCAVRLIWNCRAKTRDSTVRTTSGVNFFFVIFLFFNYCLLLYFLIILSFFIDFLREDRENATRLLRFFGKFLHHSSSYIHSEGNFFF